MYFLSSCYWLDTGRGPSLHDRAERDKGPQGLFCAATELSREEGGSSPFPHPHTDSFSGLRGSEPYQPFFEEKFYLKKKSWKLLISPIHFILQMKNWRSEKLFNTRAGTRTQVYGKNALSLFTMLIHVSYSEYHVFWWNKTFVQYMLVVVRLSIMEKRNTVYLYILF